MCLPLLVLLNALPLYHYFLISGYNDYCKGCSKTFWRWGCSVAILVDVAMKQVTGIRQSIWWVCSLKLQMVIHPWSAMFIGYFGICCVPCWVPDVTNHLSDSYANQGDDLLTVVNHKYNEGGLSRFTINCQKYRIMKNQTCKTITAI